MNKIVAVVVAALMVAEVVSDCPTGAWCGSDTGGLIKGKILFNNATVVSLDGSVRINPSILVFPMLTCTLARAPEVRSDSVRCVHSFSTQ
jgi:hypothetical protein